MTTARSRPRVFLAHAVYTVLVHLACLVAAVPWLVRVWREPRQAAWIRGRFGRLPDGLPAGRPLWIHAVSVGEVKAARPLVERLRAEHPDVPLVLSTGTLTGQDTARRAFPELYVFPLPLDLPWVVARVLRRIDPRLIVLLELEVWPGWMRLADAAGVPQVIVNGRVSASSFRSYRRLRWWLPEFDRIALAAAQDETYAERIRELGVPADRVVVTGNLKHDLARGVDDAAAAELAAELGLRGGRPVFVAGSTHDGEDGPCVEAWLQLGGGELAHLVLVPRHLDRLKDIQKLLKRLGVAWTLRSECGPQRPADHVLLVDTMGELETFFALADVVFLGGSLVPVGGHNVLEPAAAGRPVLVGPWTETCEREAGILAAAGGLQAVDDAAGLAEALGPLLRDPALAAERGARAREAVEGLAGAAAADVALLAERGWLSQTSAGSLEHPGDCGTLSRSASPPRSSTSRTGASYP